VEERLLTAKIAKKGREGREEDPRRNAANIDEDWGMRRFGQILRAGVPAADFLYF
jgi:hypothetical protein